MPDKTLREETLKLLEQSPLPGGEIESPPAFKIRISALAGAVSADGFYYDRKVWNVI